MNVQPHRSLQSFFTEVLIVQHYIQQLNAAEKSLIEISDFFDEENMTAPSQLIDHMRLEVRQLRVNFNFISTLKLLQTCRQSQTHLQQHGRLPLFDLNVN